MLKMGRFGKEVAKIQITVRVTEDVARAIHQKGPSTTESEELFKVTNELGVLLNPMHPDVEDSILASFFIVEVPDKTTADRVITHLQQSKAIEAAYVKPPDELPLV
jgi:hypothetical protein